MRTDWLSFWADITPDHIGIIDYHTGRSYTYCELNEHTERLANILQKQYHIVKGDIIAVLAKNCVEYIYLFGAAQKLGFIILPINYRLTSLEIGQLLHDIQPKFCIYQSDFSHLLTKDNDWLHLSDLVARMMDNIGVCRTVDLDGDDPLFILFTSGSSGMPKGAIYTHKMLLWNSFNTQISLKLDSKSTSIICMPPFHTGGWNVLLTPLLHTGGTAILMEKFDASMVLQLLEKYACTIFMGVPTMLKMMFEQELFGATNLSSLDYIIVGGEAMSLSLIKAYHDKGIPIRQGYGMTEVGPNITSLHEQDAIRKIGSIGKPNMYVQIKIVDSEGKDVAQDQRGELLLSGPNVTPGYYRKDEESQKCFSGDWFHTGDVVVKDTEGFLFIVDRIKNMYISGGENVYPAQVEAVLARHSAIDEVAVIGVPDSKWGETGKAIVVVKGGHTFTLDILLAHCQDQLSKYKIPKHLTIVDTLPKTDSGKIDRKALLAL